MERAKVKRYCVGVAVYIFISGLCAYGPQIGSGSFVAAAVIQAVSLVFWLLQIYFEFNNPVEAGLVSCLITVLSSLIYFQRARLHGL